MQQVNHVQHLVARALNILGVSVASALAVRTGEALLGVLLARRLPRVTVDLFAGIGVGRATTCGGDVGDGLDDDLQVSIFFFPPSLHVSSDMLFFLCVVVETYSWAVSDVEVACRAGEAPVVAIAIVACAAEVHVGEAIEYQVSRGAIFGT